MPLRSVMMKRFILGFQRRVWCPKWTPLSRSWRIVTTAMPCDSLGRFSVVPGGREFRGAFRALAPLRGPVRGPRRRDAVALAGGGVRTREVSQRGLGLLRPVYR